MEMVEIIEIIKSADQVDDAMKFIYDLGLQDKHLTRIVGVKSENDEHRFAFSSVCYCNKKQIQKLQATCEESFMEGYRTFLKK